MKGRDVRRRDHRDRQPQEPVRAGRADDAGSGAVVRGV